MKKILLLEDEEILAQMYQKKLAQAGYEVVWTKTPEETQEKAHIFPADIVILDHGIRGHDLSGLEVLPLLRSLLPKSFFVMLSNYSKGQLQEIMTTEGADDYLLKIETSPRTLLEYLEKLSVLKNGEVQ